MYWIGPYVRSDRLMIFDFLFGLLGEEGGEGTPTGFDITAQGCRASRLPWVEMSPHHQP